MKMNKYQSSMIPHQLSLGQNTPCICELEMKNLQVQGLNHGTEAFHSSAPEVWLYLHNDILKW